MRGPVGVRPGPGWWVQAAEVALDLAVPQRCAGCGRPGRAWCPSCAVLCRGGSLPITLAVPGRAAADHAGPAGRAVVAFKDAQARRLAGPLAALLAGAIQEALDAAAAPPRTPVWVVPIPTRRTAVRSRGADHMLVLAGRAARLLRRRGVPAHRCPALLHARASRDQVGLTRGQRRRNVEGTLGAQPVPAGLVVLVDDVTTTGATLGEGIRAMRAAGRGVTCAATVTRSAAPGTVRPDPTGTSVERAGGSHHAGG